MTDLQLFAFVILPVLLVIGAGALLLIERRTWRVAEEEPDLFEQPGKSRTFANSEGLRNPAKARRAE